MNTKAYSTDSCTAHTVPLIGSSVMIDFGRRLQEKESVQNVLWMVCCCRNFISDGWGVATMALTERLIERKTEERELKERTENRMKIKRETLSTTFPFALSAHPLALSTMFNQHQPTSWPFSPVPCTVPAHISSVICISICMLFGVFKLVCVWTSPFSHTCHIQKKDKGSLCLWSTATVTKYCSVCGSRLGRPWLNEPVYITTISGHWNKQVIELRDMTFQFSDFTKEGRKA